MKQNLMSWPAGQHGHAPIIAPVPAPSHDEHGLMQAMSPLRSEGSYSRYTDQPTSWKTRLLGMSGTGGLLLTGMAASLLAWGAVQQTIAPPVLTVVNLQAIETPPEPVREVPEGVEQEQQEEQKPIIAEQPAPTPEVTLPHLPAVIQPTAKPMVQPTVSVKETTAPKSMVAPQSSRASSNVDATWQALLLAHIEKYRRYPARSRARGEQGVAYVRFRMNRQGQVLSSQIIRSSGSTTLDRAALDTLKRAQPLPTSPDDMPDIAELTVTVEFFMR